MGVTVFARVVHAKAIHAQIVADRGKAFADQANAADAEALVAAAEAEARAQVAETACGQSNDAARKASQWAAAEARKTSQADKDRWSSFATADEYQSCRSDLPLQGRPPHCCRRRPAWGYVPKRRSSCRASCGLLDPAEAIQTTL